MSFLYRWGLCCHMLPPSQCAHILSLFHWCGNRKKILTLSYKVREVCGFEVDWFPTYFEWQPPFFACQAINGLYACFCCVVFLCSTDTTSGLVSGVWAKKWKRRFPTASSWEPLKLKNLASDLFCTETRWEFIQVPPWALFADERTNELIGACEWGVAHEMPKTKGEEKPISAVSLRHTCHFRKRTKYPADA